MRKIIILNHIKNKTIDEKQAILNTDVQLGNGHPIDHFQVLEPLDFL